MARRRLVGGLAAACALLGAACKPPTSSKGGVDDHPAQEGVGALVAPRHWALLSAQPPPPGFVDYHRDGAAFPDDYDEVRLHHRALDRWAGTENSLDAPVGCHGRAVTAEGTLCPSVVVRGRRVPLSVGRELARRFHAPPPEPRRAVSCDPEPRSAFVYLRRGVPVGEILVDLNCPVWMAWPGRAATIQRDEDWRWVRERVGDAARAASAWLLAQREVAAPGRAVWGQRLRPRPPEVDPARLVDELAPTDRLALCVWNTQHVFDSAMPERWSDEVPRGTVQLPGEEGTRWSHAQNWPSCVASFPTDCHRTLAEVLPCMHVAQSGDPWFANEANAGCRPLRGCLWGFVSGDGPAPRASE